MIFFPCRLRLLPNQDWSDTKAGHYLAFFT